MNNAFTLPNKKAAIFWPVGTGDSTTLVLHPGKVIAQIDLHHLEKAENKEEPEWPIIDHLVNALPKNSKGRPYLALFILTHPDQDHIRGFKELLRKVDIGELWHTPRIFRDQSDQESLCEDAKAFRKEAHRRAAEIIKAPNAITSGNRLRVIGHDDVLLDEKYKGLPAGCKSHPADIVSMVDGQDMSQHFRAFIHAPFKDDQAKDKNNTSLALNVVLYEGQKYGQFFFFGDREYPTIKRIFERTEQTKGRQPDNTPYLGWHVMLCAHHCSKYVMHWQNEGEKEASFKKDIMDFFEKYSRDGNGYIVASAHSDFTDGEGHCPPHKKARDRYSAIVKAGRFICTHEHPSKKEPKPLVFTVDSNGFNFADQRSQSKGPASLGATVAAARGTAQPAATRIGFGSK
jgi:hypothetical protein